MRTTVTLDDDLVARLREIARERRRPFKSILNETIRSGLGGPPSETPYRLTPRRMGTRDGVDLTKALQLAAQLEDHELIRKQELRK